MYISACSFLLVPLFTGAFMLAMVSLILGLSMGCAQPVTLMLIFSRAPEGRSGEALGLRMTANHLTRLVGPVMFGSIASTLGLFPMFWMNALMLGIGGLLSRPRNGG